MECLSISYKKADIDIRKKLAFTEDTQRELLASLGFSQCVALCTCNRTEIYFFPETDGENAQEKVRAALSQFSKTPPEQLAKYIMRFCSDSALNHLFSVACGIDSMVLGEDEILGQVKTAYANSLRWGFAGYEVNTVFKSAITCAKKIKTRTAISRTSVSTATLAANQAAKLGEKVNVLLIGATGKIGGITLKNLLSHKNVSVAVTVRNHKNELNLIPNGNITAVNYSERYSYADAADCIISATSAPHYTVTAQELKSALVTQKPRLFIDLAVPPDIDPTIKNEKSAALINMDDLEKLAEENNALKLDSAERAKEMISEELDVLKKELAFHDFLPQLENVRTALQNNTPEDILYELKSRADSEDFTAFLKCLRILIK